MEAKYMTLLQFKPALALNTDFYDKNIRNPYNISYICGNLCTIIYYLLKFI